MLEFFFEILMQIFLDLAMQGYLSRRDTREPRPVLIAVLCAMFGLLAGIVSVWIFPSAFIHSDLGRIANLILTPLAMGAVAAYFGLKRKAGSLRFSSFAFGYVLALSFALIRFLATRHS